MGPIGLPRNIGSRDVLTLVNKIKRKGSFFFKENCPGQRSLKSGQVPKITLVPKKDTRE